MAKAESILELYGHDGRDGSLDWGAVAGEQQCPYQGRKCTKIRKSSPDITIGTCTVRHGNSDSKDMIICPFRFLERRLVFSDCLHLLSHEPGNELHVVSEIPIPGGSVDYFLVSADDGAVTDFVGIEFQALDTSGTVWPSRDLFLRKHGVDLGDQPDSKSFGMNWKMTAKTTLVQLHHKVETFELLGKHLVLVLQDHLMNYMSGEFSFSHIDAPDLGEPMHFHSYRLDDDGSLLKLNLSSRRSTSAAGISAALELQADASISLADITAHLENKISDETRLTL